jgi:hypothetical protein
MLRAVKINKTPMNDNLNREKPQGVHRVGKSPTAVQFPFVCFPVAPLDLSIIVPCVAIVFQRIYKAKVSIYLDHDET